MATVVDINSINSDVTHMLKQLYGDRLASIILYGSYARGDFQEDSDVDYLVLLEDHTVSPHKEVSRYSSVLSHYVENTSVDVSIVVMAYTQFMNTNRLFHRQVKKDGLAIYERRPHFQHT
ncbi:nucleotidyltransferase domain-containing protein [Arsenicibacter rosenii]|uniref:Polymerase nucleotidyl transferase domain-containing protein n=1 Tax=Arsenicibacter rosenii TaxID=1750698 RepID=A0A1S2VBW7_9BACT|nr:nucleotidyltransferase domain-containing protein [Arsenicibacter rosenii]OIN56182.1 hypothetical protein BLX24_26270 [Arsenicibacter rosenii]